MEKKDLYSKTINEVYSTLTEHLLDSRGQPPIWPVLLLEGDWYISKLYMKELYSTIEKLKVKGLSNAEISKLFHAPSRISAFSWHIDFQFGGLNKQETINLLESLVSYIKYYRKEDIFCKEGKNIIWSKDEVKTQLNELKRHFIPLTPEVRNLLGKLNTTLWLYCEFINVARHYHSHEFHGPYLLENEEILIVREYYNLRPFEIWPIVSTLKFDTLITLEIYRDVKIKFDFLNHHETSAPLPPHLKKSLVSINGFKNPIMNEEELKSIIEEVESMIIKLNEFSVNFTKKDWIKKLVEMHYFYLEPHKDVLKEKWQPDKDVYKFIESNDPSPDTNYTNFLNILKELDKLSEDEGREKLNRYFLNNIFQERNR